MDVVFGFGAIFIAAVAGGAFGLQYRVQRKYTVTNTALISLFFATIAVPLIVIHFLLPGWWDVLVDTEPRVFWLVFVLGFGWGLGAITYAFGFNLLGMALAAALIKGIAIGIGSGIPLFRRWDAPELTVGSKTLTIVGIIVLLVGTWISGRAGILRERELQGAREAPGPTPSGGGGKSVLWMGMVWCLISGVLSACANLGYEFGEPLEQKYGAMAAAGELQQTEPYNFTLIRWMPMWWGGMAALFVCMGGAMIRDGSWRNYSKAGTARDLFVASSMGVVHFLAQYPYGVGEYFLGELGTTVGWAVNIGMALIVAAGIGFLCGEWKGASKSSVKTILTGIFVLLGAIVLLGFAKALEAAPVG